MSQLARWAEVVDKVTAVEGFLEWLWREKGVELSWDRATEAAALDQKKLVYEYFEVDARLLDDERRALLAANTAKFAESSR